MKHFYLICTLLLFTILTINAQPKLEIIGGDTHDWGNVSPKDSPLKAKITLKNSGTELLKITKVKPACGCTTAPLSKDELKPGESAVLDITLRVGKNQRKLTKSVSITSNDPNKSRKVLYLKCNVIHPIEITPTRYFTFRNMKVGYESVASVKVKNNTKKNLTFSDFQVKPENLNVNLTKKTTIKPGQEIDVIVKVKPIKSGSFNCYVKMKTSHPDYAQFTIHGSGKVAESELFNNK